MPEVLFVTFETIEWSGKVVDMDDDAFPETFNLQDYFDDEERMAQKSKIYKLSAVIEVEGDSLESSQYAAFVLRTNPKNPDQEHWFRISGEKRELVTIDRVLATTRPHVVIYEKKYEPK